MNFKKTKYLSSSTSFLKGMGSVLNIRGNYLLFNLRYHPKTSDAEAIAHDWYMVGQDLQNASEVFRHLSK